MLTTIASGYVGKNISKKNVNEETVAFNFTLCMKKGYGENEKPVFYTCVVFTKKNSRQEVYYSKQIVTGARLMCEGEMLPGRPYEKNGVQITPWTFMVSRIGDVNQTFLSGRLTGDAVVTVRDDTVIARFTIAVNRKDDVADFVYCTKFGRGGFEDYARKYLLKGKKIGVTGKIQTGSYTNKDGVKVNTFECNVSDFELYDKSVSDVSAGQNPESQSQNQNAKSGASDSGNIGFPQLDPDFPQELIDGGFICA